MRFLARLGVNKALGLPAQIGAERRAALVRSVTHASGKVWIGSDDHVLRKAHLEGAGVVVPGDRKLLFGATSGKLDANLTITDVGVPQQISAPKHVESYDSLQLALSALGEAVRKEVLAARREAAR